MTPATVEPMQASHRGREDYHQADRVRRRETRPGADGDEGRSLTRYTQVGRAGQFCPVRCPRGCRGPAPGCLPACLGACQSPSRPRLASFLCPTGVMWVFGLSSWHSSMGTRTSVAIVDVATHTDRDADLTVDLHHRKCEATGLTVCRRQHQSASSKSSLSCGASCSY